jgi:hypothetical protein
VETGIQHFQVVSCSLDSRLRGSDDIFTSYEAITIGILEDWNNGFEDEKRSKESPSLSSFHYFRI